MGAHWLDAAIPALVVILTEIFVFRRRFAMWGRAAPHQCMKCSPVWSYLLILSLFTSGLLVAVAAGAALTGRFPAAALLTAGAAWFLIRPLYWTLRHRWAGHSTPLHPHDADRARAERLEEAAPPRPEDTLPD